MSWMMSILFHICSLGIPILSGVITASSKVVEQDGDSHLCLPKGIWHLFLWFLPISIAFLWNLIFYGLVFFRIYRIHKFFPKSDISQLASVSMKFSFYLLVFLICWLPDLLYYILVSIFPHCRIFIASVVFNSLLSLLGFLDALVYGFTNRRLRDRFSLYHPKRAILWTAILIFSPILVLPAFIAKVVQASYHLVRYRSLPPPIVGKAVRVPGLADSSTIPRAGYVADTQAMSDFSRRVDNETTLVQRNSQPVVYYDESLRRDVGD